jgi:hypothetical protein
MNEECNTNGGEEERTQVIGGKLRRNESVRKTSAKVFALILRSILKI